MELEASGENSEIESNDENLQYRKFMEAFKELERMIIEESNKLIKDNRLHIYKYRLDMAKRIEIINMYRGDLADILGEIN